MPEAKPVQPTDNKLGCYLAIILGIGAVIWLANLDKPGSSSSVNSLDAQPAANLAVAEPITQAPPSPFNAAAARRGTAQFRMVATARVPGSSEIFSRNCYEALGKPFDWHQLDRCGGYDALAVRWTEMNEDTAGNDDLTYFQSEAAATRYAKAALGGGLKADEADQRWSEIQTISDKVRLAATAPESPTVVAEPSTDSGQDVSAGDMSNEAAINTE